MENIIGSTTYYTDQLINQSYGNGDYISFTYNDEKQIDQISFNGTVRFEYDYDSSGRLAILKDIYNSNIYFYSYDLGGRIRTITDKDGNEIRYTYDDSGNVNGYEYSIGTVSRGIEYHNNPTTGEYEYAIYFVGNTEITKEFNYGTDSLRRLNSIDLTIDSITFTKMFQYDDAVVDPTMGNATTRIRRIVYIKNGIMQYDYQYLYDENHNIIGISSRNQYGQIVDDYDYYYDGFNRLIRENITLNSGQFSKTYLYTYDAQGNLTSIADHAYTLSNPVTSSPSILTVYEYNGAWGDQLTKIIEYTNFVKTKELSYTYDANGNPTVISNLMNSAGTKTYSWDGRQLSGISFYCGGMSFKYNDQGIRTYKSIGGCSGGYSVNYVLDGDRIITETKGTSTIYYTYDADGTLISMNYNGNEYFYITNMQGDVIELVDISGITVVKYKYDSWGNIIDQYDSGLGIATINLFRYRSYYFDTETGWYYLQSRYYDPQIGRFISADGLVGKIDDVQSQNMYAYCANNPVMYTDSTGYWIGLDDAIAFLVGGIAGSVGQFISDIITLAITGEWSGSWETYVGAFVGYGFGALVTLYAGPIAGFALGGGLSTFIGLGLGNITGTNNMTLGEILLYTGFSAGIGALTGGLSTGLKIPGISAGRNSWSAVFKSGLSKLGNGSVTRMSIDVMFKGLGETIIAWKIVGGVVKGVYKGAKEWWEYYTQGDTQGLGWV